MSPGPLPAWLRQQLITGARMLLALVVVATATMFLGALGVGLLGSGSSSRSSSSASAGLTDYLAGWVLSFGLPLFGGVSLTTGAGAGGGVLLYYPALATAALGAAGFWLSRRGAGSAPEPAAAARDAAVSAAIPVFSVAVLTSLVPFQSGPVRISTNLASLVPLGFTFLFLVGFVARARTNPAAWGRAQAWAESPHLRRAGAALTSHAAAVGSVLILAGLVAMLLQAGIVDTLGWLLLSPLVGGNALVVAVGLAHGGSVSAGVGVGAFGATQSVSVFSDAATKWALLLPVAALLACLVAGLRIGLGMPVPWHRQWRDIWVTPAAFFVVWTVLFLTVGRISVSGNLSGIPFLGTAVADVAVGISPATGLLMAVWGLLVEVCARLLAPLARRRFPGLAALLLVRAWAGSPSTGVVSPAAEVPVNPGVAAAELDPDQSAATASTLIRPRVIGPAPGAPALTDRQRKQLTFWSVLAGGLCAVGLVGLLTIRWLGSAFFGPATVAEQYLADLQAGDAAAASALADPGVPNGLRGGLTNAVLGGSSARLDSVLVGEPTITESSATIPVQYSVDGQKVNTTLNAERAGSSFAVFPSWRLTSSLAQAVSVSSAVGVNISGTDVATTSPDSTDSSNHVTTYLYPGSYSVTGAKGGATAKWLIPTEASVTLTSPGSLPKTVSIATKPSPALIEELNAQAKSLIDSCAASGLASPKSTLGECPFSTYSSDGKATWKVASYPQLEVDTSAFSQTLYASTAKAGSVQGTTSSALFGPSTNTQSVSMYSRKVTIGSDGAVHMGS